jgi:oligoribonuclease NrnB/cAMP/cGMP phosphodiesterase (DHH superfamily)
MKSKKDLVNIYYHKNCSDGFGAAWVAYNKFGEEASYIPVSHDDELVFERDSINYFLDFSPKEKYISSLEKQSKEIYIIDHHISSFDYLKDKDYYYFDVDHSGCVLAWKFFFPDKRVPRLLDYIEDRDLWKNSMYKTSEVFLYTNTVPYSFDSWNELADDLEENLNQVISIGESISKYRNILIGKIANNKHILRIGGFKVESINSPLFQSYMLSKDYTGKDFMSCYYYDGERYIFSLRSSKDSKVVLSDIAKIYNGGGHKNAAGFSVKYLWQLNTLYYKWVFKKYKNSFLQRIITWL